MSQTYRVHDRDNRAEQTREAGCSRGLYMYAPIVLPLRMFEKLFLYACDDAREKDKPQNPVFFLPAMIRNAEVRFVFQGRIKESDQVLGMSDPGARAERGQSSPERSALKVENHQDFRPHRAVPEADGDEMPLEPDGPSVLLPRKTSSPAHFVLKAKRSCPTNPHLSKCESLVTSPDSSVSAGRQTLPGIHHFR